VAVTDGVIPMVVVVVVVMLMTWLLLTELFL
jgi:hypothetical protein